MPCRVKWRPYHNPLFSNWDQAVKQKALKYYLNTIAPAMPLMEPIAYSLLAR
jgi:hypothetical protein